MMDLHVELGQIIIASLIATVGFFVRREISTIAKRLDKHDEVIFNLAGSVQRLIGFYSANDRRKVKY